MLAGVFRGGVMFLSRLFLPNETVIFLHANMYKYFGV